MNNVWWTGVIFFAPLPSHVTRTLYLPRAFPCSPEKHRKTMPVLQARLNKDLFVGHNIAQSCTISRTIDIFLPHNLSPKSRTITIFFQHPDRCPARILMHQLSCNKIVTSMRILTCVYSFIVQFPLLNACQFQGFACVVEFCHLM